MKDQLILGAQLHVCIDGESLCYPMRSERLMQKEFIAEWEQMDSDFEETVHRAGGAGTGGVDSMPKCQWTGCARASKWYARVSQGYERAIFSGDTSRGYRTAAQG